MRTRRARRQVVVALILLTVVVAVAAIVVPWRHLAAGTDTATTRDGGTAHGSHPRYVALGSSYASGPATSDLVDRRCRRGADDYPHRIAAALPLDLVDVSCSGSTVPDILTRAQPGRADRPQIDAVTPDTALVTITTGGNDVHYIPRLTDLSCRNERAEHAMRTCHAGAPATVSGEAEFAALADALVSVVDAVRARAPRAAVMIVDYIPVLDPLGTLCAGVPLTPPEALETVDTFDRLTAATRSAADRAGAIFVDVAAAAQGHTVCSESPWVTAFTSPAPYHPDAAGRAAMAALTVEAIRRGGIVPAAVPS